LNENSNKESKNNDNKFNDKKNTPNNVINLSMDYRGKMHREKNDIAALSGRFPAYLTFGWICAALAVFVSPLFAVASIIFGILSNNFRKGSGNTLILTSVILAVISLLLAIFYTFTGGTIMY